MFAGSAEINPLTGTEASTLPRPGVSGISLRQRVPTGPGKAIAGHKLSQEGRKSDTFPLGQIVKGGKEIATSGLEIFPAGGIQSGEEGNAQESTEAALGCPSGPEPAVSLGGSRFGMLQSFLGRRAKKPRGRFLCLSKRDSPGEVDFPLLCPQSSASA